MHNNKFTMNDVVCLQDYKDHETMRTIGALKTRILVQSSILKILRDIYIHCIHVYI